MYDDDGRFLSKEELLELTKTREGKKLVQKYLLRARIAFTAQSLFEAMNIIPDEEMQTLVCEVIERCMISTPTSYILDYVDSIKTHYEETEVKSNFLN